MAEKPQLGPYLLTRPLGNGTTGKVRLATKVETGQEVAIKIINKQQFEQRPTLQSKTQREISLMRLVDHPHLLKLLDTLESPRHLYIVLEYASNGELFDFLVKHKTLSEDLAMHFFRQLIYGLEYLHNLGICHRDLKPENILLDGHLNIKIADFGFARFTKNNIADTSCGSPHYAAPEVIKGDPYDGRAADIWSCGVILYALLAGYLPFDDQNLRILLQKVKQGQFRMPPFPEKIQSLINAMLTLNPLERITIPQIKDHPAFRYGLPDQYVVPTPLPLDCGEEGIDASTISPEIIDLLHKIGFTNDEELQADFASHQRTMAKVFFMMLTSRVALNQLRWDLSVDESAPESAQDGTPEAIIVSPNPQTYTLGQQEDPFHRHMAATPQSLEMGTSYAAQTEWAVPTDTGVLQIHSIMCTGFQIVQAICAAEITVRQFQMQWFHPDEFTIIARHEPMGIYVVIVADEAADGEGAMLEFQLCHGPVEPFMTFYQAAEEIVSSASGFPAM